MRSWGLDALITLSDAAAVSSVDACESLLRKSAALESCCVPASSRLALSAAPSAPLSHTGRVGAAPTRGPGSAACLLRSNDRSNPKWYRMQCRLQKKNMRVQARTKLMPGPARPRAARRRSQRSCLLAPPAWDRRTALSPLSGTSFPARSSRVPRARPGRSTAGAHRARFLAHRWQKTSTSFLRGQRVAATKRGRHTHTPRWKRAAPREHLAGGVAPLDRPGVSVPPRCCLGAAAMLPRPRRGANKGRRGDCPHKPRTQNITGIMAPTARALTHQDARG